MNIMFTCAGRRNYLLGYFKEALRGKGQIIAVDNSRFAPTLQEADYAFEVPGIDHPEYPEIIVGLCKSQNVKLLFSLHDFEPEILETSLPTLRENGAIPVLPSKEVNDICVDKIKTNKFCKRLNINTPKTCLSLEQVKAEIKSGKISFPLTVKPRRGSASLNIMHVDSLEELELAFKLNRELISKILLKDKSSSNIENSIMIQEKLQGQEYGLDVINDLNGNFKTVFVKKKILMRAGETDRAITVENQDLFNIGKKIGENLKHLGNLDVDVFLNGKSIAVLEMNPRFGGGYPFSHCAGANAPAALIAWAKGETEDTAWLKVRPGVFSSKCDRLVGSEYRVFTKYKHIEPIK